MKLHGMNYRPLWPDTKIVRVTGAINDATRITFWLFWVWERSVTLCPRCGEMGIFIRDRGFADGSGKVWMCENKACQCWQLYYYAAINPHPSNESSDNGDSPGWFGTLVLILFTPMRDLFRRRRRN